MPESKESHKIIRNPGGKNQYAPKAGQGSRTERLGIRLSPDLNAAIRKAAQEQDISLTEWAEKAFLLALEAQKLTPPKTFDNVQSIRRWQD
jgi:molybdopterin-guanine dinucleotide biosynthesis protein A